MSLFYFILSYRCLQQIVCFKSQERLWIWTFEYCWNYEDFGGSYIKCILQYEMAMNIWRSRMKGNYELSLVNKITRWSLAMFDLHCKHDCIYSNQEYWWSTPLAISRRDFPEIINWKWKTYPTSEQQHCSLNREKEKRESSFLDFLAHHNVNGSNTAFPPRLGWTLWTIINLSSLK